MSAQMTHLHRGWVAVDFDATLARYTEWVGVEHTGGPIEKMVLRVLRWLEEGRDVRIFTARMWPILSWEAGLTSSAMPNVHDERRLKDALTACRVIDAWCLLHLGRTLPLTCVKDPGMIELWDDRAVQVRPNTGEVVGFSTRGLDDSM